MNTGTLAGRGAVRDLPTTLIVLIGICHMCQWHAVHTAIEKQLSAITAVSARPACEPSDSPAAAGCPQLQPWKPPVALWQAALLACRLQLQGADGACCSCSWPLHAASTHFSGCL